MKVCLLNQMAKEKPQFAEIKVNTESAAGSHLALFVKNVKPDSITIGWQPPSDPFVEIQMYEVGITSFTFFLYRLFFNVPDPVDPPILTLPDSDLDLHFRLSDLDHQFSKFRIPYLLYRVL